MNSQASLSEKDFFEISRYDLTFRVCLFMGLVLPLMVIPFYIFDQPAFYPTIIASVAVYIFLIVLKTTKKYRGVAIAISILGSALSIYTLLAVAEALHFVDALWMIIIALITYFTLGKIWGNSVLIVQFTAIVYFLFFNLNDSLGSKLYLPPGERYSLTINVILCISVIIYLINQFINRNAYASARYQEINTELESKNALVERRNQEKTAMLKEIHHRVKNNLQVITSLLRLQARDIENTKATEHFKEAVDRIAAMALIHNQMYQSDDIERIDLSSYIEALSDNILTSYIIDIPVDSELDIRVKHAPSNTIVPIALLFNELVSNSLKHGFKNREKGKLFVSMYLNKEGNFMLRYKDDGVWMPPARNDSFGLELIETLAQQLNGTYERYTENGTEYLFTLNPTE